MAPPPSWMGDPYAYSLSRYAMIQHIFGGLSSLRMPAYQTQHFVLAFFVAQRPQA